MAYDQDRHHRRSIRLKGYDYTQAGAYFVTICTHERKCLFGDIVDGNMILNDAGRFAEKCWTEIPAHFPHVALDEFVIMPNHIHGILCIGDAVGAKDFSPEQAHHPVGAKNVLPEQTRHPVGAKNVLPEQAHHPVGAKNVLPEQTRHPVGAKNVLPEQTRHPVGAKNVLPEQTRHPVGAKTFCPNKHTTR